MKLSQLVEYYQQLKSYDIGDKSKEGLQILQILRNAVADNKVPITHSKIRFGERTYLEQIEQDIIDYKSMVSGVTTNLNFYIDQIRETIIEGDKGYLENSRDIYDNGMRNDEVNTILNRKLKISPEDEATIRNRISIYSDWKYPGLCVGPMRSRLVEEMVALDPLYLCDIDDALIDPLVNSYNEVYRHRVRPYVIPRYSNNQKLFKELPTNQFGFIFVGNYFEYIYLEGIDKILEEMMGLLRPGGTIMFTFNDCDNPKNIQLAERNFRTYTPKRLLTDIIHRIGFSITFSYDASFNFSWMEIKKPGNIDTIRGGQSLASVIGNMDGMIPDKKSYTKEQEDMIIHEAIALGIDSEEKIRGGAINLGKLELLVKRRKHEIEVERKLINDIGEQNSKDD